MTALQERALRPVLVPSLRRDALAHVLMLTSGFAALGYQIVWTQQAGLWLGHEAAGILAVVGAFFGGLSIGAWLLSKPIEASTRPARWYAACEIAIAIWAAALGLLTGTVGEWLLEMLGAEPSLARHWLVAFLGTFTLLAPATIAMGATLPAMDRTLAMLSGRATALPGLYAANTLGAMVGSLATAFWLVPSFGLARTSLICAGCNVACAMLVSVLAVDAKRATRTSLSGDHVTARDASRLLALTGLLGIGYEVIVVRVLSQVTEKTIFTFALVLAVYLAGTAIGASLHRRLSFAVDPHVFARRLLIGLALACLVGAATLATAPPLKAVLMDAVGRDWPRPLAAEAGLAVAVLLLPTVLMGLTFSQLATMARAAGIATGASIAINTAGAAVAPLVFGVGLLPWLGAGNALLVVVAGYAAAGLALAPRRPSSWAAAAGVAAAWLLLPSLTIVDVPDGGRLVAHRDGATSSVSIVEDGANVAHLRIDNGQDEGTSGSWYADGRQALIPLLLHPRPRRALFLGLGTGVTALTATMDAGVRVDAIELLPEVVEASTYFRRPLAADTDESRLRVLVSDARRHVRVSREHYDVIVADNFHPARAGSAALYTREHFEAIRRLMRDGAVFCQWLPLHQLDIESLRSIVRTFVDVHPRAFAVVATNSLDTPVLGLVAWHREAGVEPNDVAMRLASWPPTRHPSRFGLDDDVAVLGAFVAGPDALRRFARDAPINADDRPIVAYLAPRATYAPRDAPRDRLQIVLAQWQVSVEELIVASAAERWNARLPAYWKARRRFIDAGRDVRATGDVDLMLAQVREPLLDVLRTSPEFRPAYDPLLRMANSLANTRPDAARELLRDLIVVQPSRPEAFELLARLGQ